jgi:Tfp pilus assembly protein PilX
MRAGGQRWRDEEGTVLVLSLITMVVLSMLGAALLTMAGSETFVSYRTPSVSISCRGIRSPRPRRFR